MNTTASSPTPTDASRRQTGLFLAALALALNLTTTPGSAQDPLSLDSELPQTRFKSGAETLQAFASIARATRHSIVKLDVNGSTVALGTVIDTNGLAVTKGSEIKPGRLTCWLAGGKEVPAELLVIDPDSDVALVRVRAPGLPAIQWAAGPAFVGQWAVTPGIEDVPQAVGIVSAPPRKIRTKRAYLGVQLDSDAASATITDVMPGFGAERAGLKAGDVIVAVNGVPVKESRQLTATLRNFREGQTVKLRVQREHQEFDAAVPLMMPKSDVPWPGLDRQARMNRLGGELSQRAEGFELAIQHDTVLQPWLCGGPLVDLQGKALGVNIARAGRTATYALPAALLNRIIEHLKAQSLPPSTRPRAERLAPN